MLVVFSSIFVVDTKIIFHYNFLALLMVSIDNNTINIYDVDYRDIIVGLTKTEAINLLSNAYLNENSGSL